MMTAGKNTMQIVVLLLIGSVAFLSITGCGDEKTECTAPDGSLITINPSAHSWDTGGAGLFNPITDDWTVRVAYPDDTPMPEACITISGALAIPYAGAAYQFQYYPSWITSNVLVDSGFSAKTNDFGQYTFSTIASAGAGTWSDQIYVRSGTNVVSAEYEIQ